MTTMPPSASRRRFVGVRLNPVIVREMRAQMRGARAFITLTGYLLVLGILTYGVYRLTIAGFTNSYGYSNAVQTAIIGKALFVVLAFLDLLLLCFVTPALTSGALSGEHERGTYDLLMATPLTPAAIFWGKFIPAMTYAFLLILASIPTFSIAYLFGGVTVRDMVQVILILSGTAIMFGALALWLSAALRRTARATIVAYILVALIIFGSLFVWGLLGLRMAIQGRLVDSPLGGVYTIPPYPLYLNPFSALGSAMLGTSTGDLYYGFPYSLFTGNSPFNLQYAAGMHRPLWQYTLSLYAILTLVFYLLALQNLKPIRRWHFTRHEIRQNLATVGAILGLVYVTFGTTWASTGMPGSGTISVTPLPVPIEVRPEMPVAPPIAPAVDTDAAVPALQGFVARKLFPEQEAAFCSFFMFSAIYAGSRAELEGAIYCQAFDLQADGTLQPGAGEQHSVSAVLTAENGVWTVAESNLDVTGLDTTGVDWSILEQDVLQQAIQYQESLKTPASSGED